MRLLSDLVGKHDATPIVVVGGGPSAPEQVKLAPEGSLFISANEHGTYLGLHDYFVIVDDLQKKPEKLERMVGKAPIIGRDWWVDYRITPYQNVGNSGMQAAYVAMLLGGYPILLAGMDYYAGNTYFHTERERSSGHLKPPGFFDRNWRNLKGKLDVQKTVVRSLGGPTVSVFGQYDPAERLPTFERARIRKLFVHEAVEVEATEPCPIVGFNRRERMAPKGSRFLVTKDELSRYSRTGGLRQVA